MSRHTTCREELGKISSDDRKSLNDLVDFLNQA